MDTRELFERYGDAVFRLAWSCTGSRQDAEDVTQTVFLKVLERRPDLEPGKERAWLFRVAVNECRSLWRRLKLRRTEPLEEALAVAAPQEEPVLRQVMELKAPGSGRSSISFTTRASPPGRRRLCWGSARRRSPPAASGPERS